MYVYIQEETWREGYRGRGRTVGQKEQQHQHQQQRAHTLGYDDGGEWWKGILTILLLTLPVPGPSLAAPSPRQRSILALVSCARAALGFRLAGRKRRRSARRPLWKSSMQASREHAHGCFRLAAAESTGATGQPVE